MEYRRVLIRYKEGWKEETKSDHDCLFLDGKMIDGGRQYIRSTGDHVVFAVKNGKFIEKK